MKIRVKTKDIDYYAYKKDAIVVYMQNEKVWVCEKFEEENADWTILTLKGKSE